MILKKDIRKWLRGVRNDLGAQLANRAYLRHIPDFLSQEGENSDSVSTVNNSNRFGAETDKKSIGSKVEDNGQMECELEF